LGIILKQTHFGIALAVAFVLTMHSDAALAASTVTWARQIPGGPVPRIEDALVYDSVSNRVVMFGGYDLNWNRLNDIWEYNGATKTWVDVTPQSGPLPTRRSGHTMAFDPIRRVIILFGGLDDSHNYLGDTWEWNTVNKTWTNVTPAGVSPSVRQGARLVKDALNDRMVLVGGTNGNHFFPLPPAFGPSNDVTGTWAFNLNAHTWSQLTPASSPAGQFAGRTFAAVGYNSDTNRVTLFGGIGFAPGMSSGTVLDFTDTWELQGNTWVRVATTGPGGRGWTHLVFDQDLHRMVVFGGWNNTSGFSWGDTWSFAGGIWSQISTASPGIRDSHGMVYDTARQKMVVFGGYLADVLELSGNTWSTALRIDFPPGQDQHAMAYDTFRNTIFMYGGGSLESWELAVPAAVWSWYYIPGPNGRTGATAVYDQSRRRMLLFGGRQRANGIAGSKLGDTWEYNAPNANSRTWTNVSPATSPPPRDGHAMAYDASRNRTVLFGGRASNGSPLGDTWVWNGTTWASVATPAGLTPRFGHAMAYDVARGVIVLFGGDSGAAKLNDVWEWNGATWQQRTPAGASPTVRANAAISSLDGSTPGVVIFGGLGAALLNDTWIWNGTKWMSVSSLGASPTPRQGARMIYHSASQRLVMYGGADSRGISTEMWSSTLVVDDSPVTSRAGDFDGDGKADVTVFRPGNGSWFILKSNTNFTSAASHQWGFSTDKPVPGDYDGDGIADIAIYRPGSGTWYILKSSANFAAAMTFTWGFSSDTPVPADYDGDGTTDIAIYRPGSGVWYILKSSANFAAAVSYTWGLGADIPVPGDYDGDGAADIAVYRPSGGAWYILKSSANFTAAISYTWGIGADIPVAADYDGDGRADIAVYRPGSGVWYILRSSTNFTTAATYTWGGSNGDIPTPADFDGDGKIDVAIYRPGTGVWHILKSTTNFTAAVNYVWGQPGDVPVLKRP
jgi:hypothetical protein